ncbi:MAG: cell division protein FtsQ/DivIB [Phycisphaerae bacterium]|nr:cell division protein FtsQ/DivIB [Phycisphaerae bacterium]
MARKKKAKTKKKNSPGLIRRIAESLVSEHGNFARKWLVFVIVFTILAVGLNMGFGRLEGYVKEMTRQRGVKLGVRMERPAWATEDFINEICRSSGIKCDDFLLDETLIAVASKKLKDNPWVKTVRQMRKCYDGSVIIDCAFREPLATLQQNDRFYYVDTEGVVLPAMNTHLHLVKLEGFIEPGLMPGRTIASEPLGAGLEVLKLICDVEGRIKDREDRLWDELKSINVSNFAGRLNQSKPHLKLLTQQNTEIRWGAAVGQEISWMEASYKDKLFRLYQEHNKYKSLDVFSYLDLRDRRKDKSDPLRQG